MSEPNSPGHADPGATTPGATEATAGEAGQAGGDAGKAGADYEARLRSGGEFAVGEAKNQQSRADRAEGKVRELTQRIGQLESYFERGVSGDAIAENLGVMQRMLEHPQLGEIVRNFATSGTFQVTTGRNGSGNRNMAAEIDDDEDLMTDEEKEIRALRAELNSIKSHIGEHESSLGQQALTRHLESVATELHLESKDVEKIREKLAGNIKQWSTQGETGRAAIRNLQTESGGETVRMLAMNALGMKRIEELVRASLLRENQIRYGMETDGPSGVPPGGGEPIPEAKSALEALRMAKLRPELLDRVRA